MPSRSSTLPAVVPQLSPARTFRREESNFKPLSIYPSLQPIERLVCDLMPFYGEDCPVAVVSDTNEIIQGTLATIAGWFGAAESRQPVRILIG
jgi:precorrin-4 methylase